MDSPTSASSPLFRNAFTDKPRQRPQHSGDPANSNVRESRPLAYSPFEKLSIARPVDRLDFVASCCVGKRVLDLGAYDETEVSKLQHSSWRWLHAEIAARASSVVGVDSADSVKQ